MSSYVGLGIETEQERAPGIELIGVITRKSGQV